MKVFWHDAQLKHAPRFFLLRGMQRPNFEVPARAKALLASCQAMRLEIAPPEPVTRAALLAVHDASYLDFLRDGHATWSTLPDAGEEVVANSHPSPEMLTNGARAPEHIIGQAGWFTADAACPIGPHTWESSSWAAACALAAADEAAAGRSAYALARPPGHHTFRARAGGHCYVNNAALAAERLRASGAARVAVLDIDGFSRAGQSIGDLRLPTAIVQEGGYNTSLLGELLARFLKGFGR